MSKRKTKRPYGRGKQGQAFRTMPKWKAWLLIGVMLSLTGLLLWYGLVIDVRCDRVQEGRVDVTVGRRFCGFINLSSTTVQDVVQADVYYVWARSSGGGRQSRGFTEALELRPRIGPVLRRNRFGPSFGTHPEAMATRINHFISESSEPSVSMWWMPWLFNVGAIPFVLILGGILGEVLLRALGFFRTAPLAGRKEP